ncbi:MAG TPA: GIY-YIG nuclease family protein, partial [Candidatus Paceibacterota bacterium]
MKNGPKNLPDKPGVYFFLRKAEDKSKGKEILYIGKAASLRSRVRSYFSNDIVLKRSAAIGKMVQEATKVDYKVTDSVLEALILEAELIKKHKPYYNVREKDDRSFNFVVITDEEYPRVLVMRGKK